MRLSFGWSSAPFSVIEVPRFCHKNLQSYIKHALFERMALLTFLFSEFDVVALDVAGLDVAKRVEWFV